MKRVKLYIIWAGISIVILTGLFLLKLNDFLFYIIIALLLKDLVIDLDILKIIKRFRLHERISPCRKYLEHAPLSAMVAILSIFGYVGWVTGLIALADFIIDFWDDQAH